MNFMEINTCMEILNDSYSKIRGLTKEGLQMLLGVIVDQYGSDHNMTSDQTISILQTLLQVQAEVHASHGMMEKSSL